ncbi:MAG: YggS family pyridoxal phosphate-dependent enzyme [Gemmatimonadaceae bacterium]|nr:YggS family pyridoxal phosphate-dependent enzyme [Gemmatimonadaceae bacterium]
MHFPEFNDRLADARARIEDARARGGHGQSVTLVAVTKTHGPEAVQTAYAAGITDVGENKVQEAQDKMAQVAAPVRWHLIGHLQRNKVKFTGPFALIHGVDSRRLAEAIDEFARKRGVVAEVLMQVNVSGEATKGGLAPDEWPAEADAWRGLTGLRVRGVMTMAPFGAAESELRRVFAGARAARDVLRAAGHPADELSMGMSEDYPVAVEEGATMVRLGTALFGARTTQ